MNKSAKWLAQYGMAAAFTMAAVIAVPPVAGEEAGRQVLPPLPRPPAGETRLSAAPKIWVKRILLSGNTVFSDEELGKLTAPYQGRKISAEELQKLKRLLTGYYIRNGYVNSGAIIPDQNVRDGEINIHIIEGRLTRIELGGNKRLRTAYLNSRLEFGAKGDAEALHVGRLQEQLKRLEQKPFIDRINAELGPGIKPGEGVLKVNVTESQPYRIDVTVNNHRSPSVGSYRGEVEFTHLNLTGWGDSLSLRYGLTDGLDDYALDYAIPVTRKDTMLSLSAKRNDADVVEAPFSQLQMESKTDTYAIGINHPFYRTVSREFSMGLKLTKRHSETFLLGSPYEFSPGAANGESDISVVSFSQEWLDRSRDHVTAFRSTFNLGLDILDATTHLDLPDGRFTTWLGQFQFLKRLPLWDSQILFRLDMQLANDPLLSLEKFSIGGASTVRGYRENHLTRDNGYVTSLEWRVPVGQLKLPKISTRAEDGVVELAPFVDFGKGWNQGRYTASVPHNISSVGLGIRWQPAREVRAQLYYAKALRNVDITGEHDLQDESIHFQISARVF
ncbi:MAG: ShlB/FhaC/HecB family hemolysin secretion/activation protein [Gammaproteobacteria bacterium]|nr:ShlB/FhaC/HecB family hemolysin secretion/activation protein [Gammaproteobacteria bacterium]